MSVDTAADSGQQRRTAAHWSITTRLTLLYTLSAFGMLAAVTTLLYSVLIRGMERDDLFVLADKVHMLEMTLRFHGDDLAMLDHEMYVQGGTYKPHQHYIYYCRILDNAGQDLIETPDMDSLVPASRFPPPMDPAKAPEAEAARHWQSPDGRAYFLMSVWARSGGDDGPRRIIQVALDGTEEAAMLADYRRHSLTALALGTLLFAAFGVLVARQGMRPLQAIARTAERITASQLDERIDPALWPKELTALAQAFNRMLSRLGDSFTRMSQCSADLAHELRSPIHNLIGEAEVALSRERQPGEYRKILESSLEEYERLSRMINEMLFLARAENPQTQIERTRLDGHRELEAVREFHDALAEEHGVSIICRGHALLDADPLLFRRAVSNLLSNALQHTPRGGRITLSISQPDDSWVVISVADTGCGITPQHLPRVLDRFYRADRTSPQHPDRTGLGLPIVRSITELHGGFVSIESTLGVGTTVFMRFPAPLPAEACDTVPEDTSVPIFAGNL